MVKKVISGGQTGADRGGLDAAIALNVPHGGWCPKGRKAEDGRIPDCYELEETGSSSYPARTRKNIIDSDVTIIFVFDVLGRGSKLTLNEADRLGKPASIIDIKAVGEETAAQLVREFFQSHKPDTINVAGSRESKAPGIQKVVQDIMTQVLS
jgi:hypothetical protein